MRNTVGLSVPHMSDHIFTLHLHENLVLQGPWINRSTSQHFRILLRHVMGKLIIVVEKCHLGTRISEVTSTSQACSPLLLQAVIIAGLRRGDVTESQPHLRTWLSPCSTCPGHRGLWTELTILTKRKSLVSNVMPVWEQHLWGKTHFKSLLSDHIRIQDSVLDLLNARAMQEAEKFLRSDLRQWILKGSQILSSSLMASSWT